MALPERDTTSYTEEEYLAFDLDSDIKNEYANGQIFAMAGAHPDHSRITMDTASTLNIQLMDGRCEVFQSEQRVKVSKTGAYRYPDVVVVCDSAEFADTNPPSLLNPTVIIEVLSKSTEDKDYNQKLQEYRRIPSLKEYIIISQDKPQVERFLRQDDINWLYTALEGIDKNIDLPSIGCTLKFSDIYRRVNFDDEQEMES